MTDNWPGDDRRNTEFNVRGKILAAIDATDDKNQRNVLLLMFGVLEVNESGMRRIEKKIDAVLKDEATIKRMALNGHELNHHEHHDWVEARMEERCQDVCAWSRNKMTEEATAETNKKGIVQKFFEGAAGHAGSMVAGGVLMWFAVTFLK